jgi:CheY-like chemotaxis protein
MAHTVLIVEDSDNVVPLEIALATLDGIRIVTLPNGRDALNLLRTTHLDLVAVITDLNLPYIDGFELIKAIRANDHYSKLPIVVISADSRPETPGRLRILGANAFFTKPYSPAEIRHALEGLLHAK